MTAMERFLVREYCNEPNFVKYLSMGIIKVDRVAELVVGKKFNAIPNKHSHHPKYDLTFADNSTGEVKCWTTYRNNGGIEITIVKHLIPKFGSRLLCIVHATQQDRVYLIDVPAGIWEPYVKPKWNKGELTIAFTKKKQWWFPYLAVLEDKQ